MRPASEIGGAPKRERPNQVRQTQSSPAKPSLNRLVKRTTFQALFSHSGAGWIAGVANRSINAAKARLAVLGISPEDPPSKNEDPKFKLS